MPFYKITGIIYLSTGWIVCLVAAALTVYIQLELIEAGFQYMYTFDGRRSHSFSPAHLVNIYKTTGTIILVYFAITPIMLGIGFLAFPHKITTEHMILPRVTLTVSLIHLAATFLVVMAALAPYVVDLGTVGTPSSSTLYRQSAYLTGNMSLIDWALLGVRICRFTLAFSTVILLAIFAIGFAPSLRKERIPFLIWLIPLGISIISVKISDLSIYIQMSMMDPNLGLNFIRLDGGSP